MVMFILEDFESEVRNVRYINPIVMAEESTFVHSQVGVGRCAAEMGSRCRLVQMSLWSFSTSIKTACQMIGVAR